MLVQSKHARAWPADRPRRSGRWPRGHDNGPARVVLGRTARS